MATRALYDQRAKTVFVGTLLETINMGSKRIAIFSVR